MEQQGAGVISPLMFWRLVSGAVLLAVMVGSLAPGHVTVVPFDLPNQKHFLAYTIMGFLFMMALRGGWRTAALVAVGLGAMGFGIELLQGLIPGRFFHWDDVRANVSGALVGAGVGWGVGMVVRRNEDK